MDTASARWLFDPEMEHSDTINVQVQAPLHSHPVNVSHGIKPYSSRSVAIQKSSRQDNSSIASSKIISFGDLNMKIEQNNDESMGEGRVSMHAPSRIPARAREHVLAERKRRERLTQHFISLSSLIPGLKKLDKSSVLGDAIKYIKHLQDRKRILEKATVKGSTQSFVCVKKSVISGDEDSSFQTLPEIEVRALNSNLLIRIHCERDGGIMAKIISEIDKFHLTMINSVCIPFGNTTLDITIIAQVDMKFNLSAEDFVQKLRSAILNIV